MYYCVGEFCSKRNKCAHNKPDTSGRLQQWLDMSTQGSGHAGIDKDGKSFCKHEYECGDRALYYKHYTNSEGLDYDEECLTCQYRGICFLLLEKAGMITTPGKKVRFVDCYEIKAKPDYYRKEVEAWLGKPIEEVN